MKYVFGVNITDNKNNSIMDGQIFHNNSSEAILNEAFRKSDEITQNLAKQTSLPVWMEIIMWLSMSAGCLILWAIIGAGVPPWEAYANAPILFYVMIILFIVFFILYLAERNKKKYQRSSEYSYGQRYAQSIAAYAKDVLKIPPDAQIIEVLSFYYKIKNGKMKVVEKTNPVDRGFVSYQNRPFYTYVRNEILYLADFYDEWAIPLCCFTGIKRINKKISVPGWKKETPYNKGEYKKYKMLENGLGYIFFKPYYSFNITYDHDNYELLIPPYEFESLTSLLNLHIPVS